jgi:hypothetical protein
MTSCPTVAQRFAAALTAEAGPDLPDPELLPVRLARAVVRVLPVDGAGISVLNDAAHRAPLGGSDDDASLTERLQFTVGAGPCLQAHESRRPVFVVEEDIRRRWPAFAEQLLVRTPYRGIVALPLRHGIAGLGAMDLFFRRPGDVPELDVFEALTVGDLVTAALAEAAVWSTWAPADGPDWLHSPPAERRAHVWRAMGLTSVALDVSCEQALGVLREEAYAAGRTVDDLAHDLLAGRLDPREFQHTGAPPA